MISESQDFFCKLTPRHRRAFCVVFLGVALSPLAIRACLSPYFACAQYGLACRPISLALNTGLLVALFRLRSIRALNHPGVALRLPRAVFWHPLRALDVATIGNPGLRSAYPGLYSGALSGRSIPPSQICHICRRQMSIHLAIFVTSAVGRCLFPIAIYGEGGDDRPGVRSKASARDQNL